MPRILDEVGLPYPPYKIIGKCFSCGSEISELDIETEHAKEDCKIQLVNFKGKDIEEGEEDIVILCHLCKKMMDKTPINGWVTI